MPKPWMICIRLLDAVAMNVSIVARFSTSFRVPLIPQRWNLPLGPLHATADIQWQFGSCKIP
jgi:hypothetical protein